MQLYDVRPMYFERGSTKPTVVDYLTAAGRRSLLLPQYAVLVGQVVIILRAQSIDLDITANWDASTYATAANRAGKDFYIYALSNGATILSANATVPTGWTSDNSRRIGGFHCECLSVGTISGHTLTGFLTGDILPASIWDLKFQPSCSPAGMVYSSQADIWVDIYLQSGTGATTASVNGATITDTRTWMDHVDDLAKVGKRLLNDAEFQVTSDGSNQLTNIFGSADPVTTGGHIDTASRRMISHLGIEDMCGAMYQWLSDQGYQNDAAYAGTFAWYTLPGSKGSIYRQGATGDVKLRAGGAWSSGPACGSRCRTADSVRWNAFSGLGARGCASAISI